MPTTLRFLLLLILGLFGLEPVSYAYDVPVAFLPAAQYTAVSIAQTQATTAESAAPVSLNSDRERAALDSQTNLRTTPNSQAAETTAGTGYRSFSAFKRAEGVAGEGQAWHHVVEQTPSNVERFGAEAIHNTENLVQLPHGPGTIHNQISGFYSSKQPFTNGLTVRQWLSPQTFQEQATFGRNAIQQFGGPP